MEPIKRLSADLTRTCCRTSSDLMRAEREATISIKESRGPNNFVPIHGISYRGREGPAAVNVALMPSTDQVVPTPAFRNRRKAADPRARL